MNAIQVHRPGGPDALRVEQLPDPQPGPGEVLVRVEAAGVNFIEVYQRRGLYPRSLPFTPGTEGAGIVVAVGDGVTTVKAGDTVASVALHGSYAELAVARAEDVVALPAGMHTRTAAAVMLQGLTAHYLATSTFPLADGDVCLVHAAAGGVGLLLCQIAAARGARVIGTTSTEAKAELAREAGAQHVILYTEQNFVPEVKRITDGHGVRVVYDSVGRDTFDRSIDCLQPRGMLALFGQSSGPVPPFDPQTLNRKGSLFLTRPALMHYTASRDARAARATDGFARVMDGSLRVRIDSIFALEEAAEAHRVLEGRRTSGKVLLEATAEPRSRRGQAGTQIVPS